MNNRNIYSSRRAARRLSPGQYANVLPPRRVLIRNVIIIAVVVAAAVAVLAASQRHERSLTPVEASWLRQVELPSGKPEQLIGYTGFKVSFNSQHHQPNYVMWELTGEEALGQEPRKSKFRADPKVFGSATPEDYRNSGYDRGHMAPAADMKWSPKAMNDSHFMTNICPQDHAINSGRWSTLENKCRAWAVRDSALIIISGPVLSDKITRTIGNGVSVPRRFFKIIVAPYATPPTSIAFIVPNQATPEGIQQMATSIDRVEEITGIDFFPNLPDSIAADLESQHNFNYWNRRNK